MFELFKEKKNSEGPLKKLSEKEIQNILYGHLKKDAQAETRNFQQDLPKPQAVKIEIKKPEQKAAVAIAEIKQAPKPVVAVKPEAKIPVQEKKEAKKEARKEAELFRVDRPSVEYLKKEVADARPKISMPRLSMPKIELPKFNMPKIDIPSFDFSPLLKKIKAYLPFITIAVIALVILRISSQALQAIPSKLPKTNDVKISKTSQIAKNTEKLYTIQVAIYSKEQDAERIVASLLQKEFDASYIKTSNSKGSPRYRVYVGNFDTKEEASGVLKKIIEEENFIDSFVRVR